MNFRSIEIVSNSIIICFFQAQFLALQHDVDDILQVSREDELCNDVDYVVQVSRENELYNDVDGILKVSREDELYNNVVNLKQCSVVVCIAAFCIHVAVCL